MKSFLNCNASRFRTWSRGSYSFLLSLILLSCTSLRSPEVQGPRKTSTVSPSEGSLSPGPVLRSRLVILPFLDAEETRPQALRDRARDRFVKQLLRSRQFLLVDPADLKIDFPQFVHKSEYDWSKLAPQAHSLGVAVLMEGRIQKIQMRRQADEVGIFRQVQSQFDVQVRLRLISSKSRKEILNLTRTVNVKDSGVRVAENATAESLMRTDPDLIEDLVTDAFLEFQEPLRRTMEKLSWEGRIAAIQGERFFLNVGQVSGLSMGDILKVTEDGEDIYDPQTGNFIGRAAGRVKGTLEVVSYFGQDGAIAILHSGAGFKENDRIELY